MKDQEAIKVAFSNTPKARLPGLKGVSLMSRLRTRLPTERSCAAPQALAKGSAGPVHHFWPSDDDETDDMGDLSPVSVNLQGSDIFTIGTTAECVRRASLP